MTRSLLPLLPLALLLACPPAGGGGADDDDAADDDDGDEVIDCAGVSAEVTDLTVHELADMLEAKDFRLINVHVPYAGEIVGTDVHVPYTDIDAIEAELGGEPGAKVVLYCLTGPMSATATAALVDRGYCNVFDLPDGLVMWEYEGYPTNGRD